MANSIIDTIRNSCNCDREQAEEHLNNEINNLRELRDLADLRFDDFQQACANLGLETDYVEYFLNALAY
ncbi:MAG: hypothetical protein LBH58_07760 [Tannerellaceae bacterium]|jgi:hypothetical protein|nr:hypothetical protein [Tannerellaceae bacterium]